MPSYPQPATSFAFAGTSSSGAGDQENRAATLHVIKNQLALAGHSAAGGLEYERLFLIPGADEDQEQRQQLSLAA